jgi:hypothetical protein
MTNQPPPESNPLDFLILFGLTAMAILAAVGLFYLLQWIR